MLIYGCGLFLFVSHRLMCWFMIIFTERSLLIERAAPTRNVTVTRNGADALYTQAGKGEQQTNLQELTSKFDSIRTNIHEIKSIDPSIF